MYVPKYQKERDKCSYHSRRGQLGYWALVLSVAALNAISNSLPFVRPVHPGDFTVTVPIMLRGDLLVVLTVQDIAQQKLCQDENFWQYNECQSVEQFLHLQIIEAVPEEYLDTLRNSDTDMIHESIPTIISFLQRNYGKLA